MRHPNLRTHILLGLSSVFVFSAYSGAEEKSRSSFEEVWAVVAKGARDPGDATPLPVEQMSLEKIKKFLVQNGVRTLTDSSDLLDHEKLLRPNGICLSGKWRIKSESEMPAGYNFTGLFSPGRQGSIIARASVNFDAVSQGSQRSFGMAGKVFPSASKEEKVQTANFFVIDDNAGTNASSYFDAQMTNSPELSAFSGGFFSHLQSFLAISGAQKESSKQVGEPKGVTGSRQLYPLSEAGEKDPSKALTPAFMKIKGLTPERLNPKDFRDELIPSKYSSGKIGFEILVSDDQKSWTSVGTITFDKAAVSDGCNHKLHFSHPIWR